MDKDKLKGFDKMLINQCFGALVDEKTNAK